MKKTIIYIVGPQKGYFKAFDDSFVLTGELSEADVILFTGGEDVSPLLYGAEKHITTGNNLQRDEMESSYFDWAKENDKMIVGICRGLNVAQS